MTTLLPIAKKGGNKPNATSRAYASPLDLIFSRDKTLTLSFAILEALDYLQERLCMPFSVFKQLKEQFYHVIEASIHMTDTEVCKLRDKAHNLVTDTIDWAKTKINDMIGVVSWIASGIMIKKTRRPSLIQYTPHTHSNPLVE